MSSEKILQDQAKAFFPEPKQDSMRALLAGSLQNAYDMGRMDAMTNASEQINDLLTKIRRAGW